MVRPGGLSSRPGTHGMAGQMDAGRMRGLGTGVSVALLYGGTLPVLGPPWGLGVARIPSGSFQKLCMPNLGQLTPALVIFWVFLTGELGGLRV